ncbi:MAG: amino acid-binding protein [Chloroflexi bacterium]|nr:amino acid-binding protein [Chloroflexota bacterium]
MAMDLTVILQNVPGTIADLGESLGKAGVNIDGGCGFPSEGVGLLHILVQEAAPAKQALMDAGFEVRNEREVLVLDIEDTPGELGRITRSIANAGVNADLFYLTASGQLVLGVDDLDKARATL